MAILLKKEFTNLIFYGSYACLQPVNKMWITCE